MTWPSDFWRVGDVAASHLADWLASKAGPVPYKATGGDEDYDVIRADFETRLTDAFQSAVSTNGRAARNAARLAVVEDVPAAFERGYADGGGEEIDAEDNAWATDEQARQLAFMSDAVSALRELGDAITEDLINSRVGLWLGTLDAIYAHAKLLGAKNKMLTWHLGSTEKHCATCAKLDGQRHSAKWWLNHNYIPRQPGSETLDCGGWQCDCSLADDEDNEFTVEAQ